MRGAQRKQQLVLLRQFLGSVAAGTYNSSSAAASTSTTARHATSSSPRSLWNWSGPGCLENRGFAKPLAFLWDGTLKRSGGGPVNSFSLRQTRGAKVSGSEVIFLGSCMVYRFIANLLFFFCCCAGPRCRNEAENLLSLMVSSWCFSCKSSRCKHVSAPIVTDSFQKVKPGFIIMRKGRITQVLKMQHTQQGRGGATIQVELRDVQSGVKCNERLRTGEPIEKVFVDDRTYSFLYEEGDTVYLMEPNSFEQLDIPKSFFGPAAAYLTDGMEVKVQYFDGKPLCATVPDRMTCTVVEAEPYFKGQAATPQYKKVVLDNGQQIMAPSFIVAGDRVVVDTAENLYMTRAKE